MSIKGEEAVCYGGRCELWLESCSTGQVVASFRSSVRPLTSSTTGVFGPSGCSGNENDDENDHEELLRH
jgi:hypothetical protein